MTSVNPLIPADAGIQCFGCIQPFDVQSDVGRQIFVVKLSLDPGVRRDEREQMV